MSGIVDLIEFAGKGLKVRSRLYLVPPQQQSSADVSCSERLMEKAECEGTARRDCHFSKEDARLICGMKKEVSHLVLCLITGPSVLP